MPRRSKRRNKSVSKDKTPRKNQQQQGGRGKSSPTSLNRRQQQSRDNISTVKIITSNNNNTNSGSSNVSIDSSTMDAAATNVTLTHIVNNVYDACCFVIYCAQHHRILLTKGGCKFLPFVPLNAAKTWLHCSIEGALQILLGNRLSNAKLAHYRDQLPFSKFCCIHVFRFQLPQSQRFITRLIYLVVLKNNNNDNNDNDDDDNRVKIVTNNQSSTSPSSSSSSTFSTSPSRQQSHPPPLSSPLGARCCQRSNTPTCSWYPVNLVISSRLSNVWGPEVSFFANIAHLARPISNTIVEYSLSDAYKYVPHDPPSSSEEQMLNGCNVTVNDIERLYADFIEHCFPSFFLTRDSFTAYMLKHEIETNAKVIARYYSAFRFRSKQYMQFHELLLGLAAIDARTPHGETRVALVFRYYDYDKDGLLNFIEFRRLLRDVSRLNPNIAAELRTRVNESTLPTTPTTTTTASPPSKRPGSPSQSSPQSRIKITDRMIYEEMQRIISYGGNGGGGVEIDGSFDHPSSSTTLFITYEQFRRAVGQHIFRGTSRLCRSLVSPFVQIIRSLATRKLCLTTGGTGATMRQVVLNYRYGGANTIGTTITPIGSDDDAGGVGHGNTSNIRPVSSTIVDIDEHRCPSCVERNTRQPYRLAVNAITFDEYGRCIRAKQIISPKKCIPNYSDSGGGSGGGEGSKIGNKIDQYNIRYSLEVIYNSNSIEHYLLQKLHTFNLIKGNARNFRGLFSNIGNSSSGGAGKGNSNIGGAGGGGGNSDFGSNCTTTTADEQQKFFLDVQYLCTKVAQILESEERILQLDDPCYIIGDIHGNLEDLLTLEQSIWRSIPLITTDLLFLGDYVDRGRWGFECFLYLIILKLLAPSKVHLLRGNHEIRVIQLKYSFHNELIRKYGVNNGQRLFDLVNYVFDRLPVCAIVHRSIYTAHGGLPYSVQNLSELNQSIPTCVQDPEREALPVWELLWSDPLEWKKFPETAQLLGIPLQTYGGTFLPNTKRGTSFVFNEYACTAFLNANNLDMIIRAHEVPPLGFRFDFGTTLCMTIFSCSHYCGADNESACALVDRDTRIRVIRIDTSNNAPATGF